MGERLEGPVGVANVVQGHGPGIRLLQLADETNKALVERGKAPFSYVLPGFGPESKQEFVLKDEFGTDDSSILHRVYLDEMYGGHLQNVFFQGKGSYPDKLEHLVKHHHNTQAAVNDHFSKPFEAYAILDPENRVTIEPTQAFELARNQMVTLPFENGVVYTMGDRRGMLQSMIDQKVQGYTPDLLARFEETLQTIEAPRTITFLQDPATVEPREKKGIIRTPFHNLLPTKNTENIKKGVYVNVTGIAGRNELFAQSIAQTAESLGIQTIYANKSQAGVLEATGLSVVKASPTLIPNENIVAVFGRPGWGYITDSVLVRKPMILPQIDHSDDPEIILNYQLLVDSLGIAAVADGQQGGHVLGNAIACAQGIDSLLEDKKGKYGTLEGPVYAGNYLAKNFNP